MPELDLPFTLPPMPAPARKALDIAAHEAWFRTYAALERSACPHDPGPEDLKLDHTFKVLDNARCICAEEKFAPPLARACLLAALYHDIGRFPQYRLWRTFKDRDSQSHGELGAAVLEKAGCLHGERHAERTVIRAVSLHNARELPRDLPVDLRLVTETVRDADKLDILRVMNEHLNRPGPYEPTVVLSLPDDPGLYSQTVIDCALKGTCGSYGDLRSVNDFRLLLGSWLNALSFSSSKSLMARQGHAVRLLEKLPDAPYALARDSLLAALRAVS